MAIRERTLANGSVIYWVMVRWKGRQEWERAGTDRREADRLEKRRKAEVEAGTYVPPRKVTTILFGKHVAQWLKTRDNRATDNEASMVTRHVLKRAEHARLCGMKMNQIQPPDIFELFAQLKKQPRDPKNPTSKPLAPKTISASIASPLRTMFRDAHFKGVIPSDPWTLPKKTISRKVTKKRTTYPMEDVQKLLAAPLEPHERVFIALLIFTGCRLGEVCGRRWRTWDKNARPLGSLLVDTQYDDKPLKGDDEDEDRPRLVPVHPALDRVLQDWWATGFELTNCRRPTIDDFIVPQRDGSHRTKSAGYKLWRRICVKAGVENRTAHSTRHTFITLALRFGAHKPTLERVTHNAKGDMVDQYNHPDWEPLCQSVSCFPACDSNVDPRHEPAGKQAPAPGLEPGSLVADTSDQTLTAKNAPLGRFVDSTQAVPAAVKCDANHASVKAWYDDPDESPEAFAATVGDQSERASAYQVRIDPAPTEEPKPAERGPVPLTLSAIITLGRKDVVGE